MKLFKRARIRYILQHHAINHGLWVEIAAHLSLFQGMTAVEKAHLRELTTLFLHEKNFIGAQGFHLNDFMQASIAVQACICILGIGLNCLSGWTDIIVYPGPFRVSRDVTDAAGVVHHHDHILIGESWLRGPVVLSWADVEQDMQQSLNGRNVVIHEMAHKLDALNGVSNGYPPLHYGMSVPEWTTVMSQAYESLIRRLELEDDIGLDPYAATSPAEFFAVISEYFFCQPEQLNKQFPKVYRQLQLYYRQDPVGCKCQSKPA